MKVIHFKIRINDEHLHEDQKRLNQFLSDNNILKYESSFVSKEDYWSVIIYYELFSGLVKEPTVQKFVADAEEELSADELKILESLREWRSGKSKQDKIPAYFIATNKELISIAKYKPAKKEELKDIRGFGRHKIENYGVEIIELLENV